MAMGMKKGESKMMPNAEATTSKARFMLFRHQCVREVEGGWDVISLVSLADSIFKNTHYRIALRNF
jgi:hypothetical protein